MPLARDLRLIYTAADQAAAAAALEAFATAWGDRYPAIVKLWRAHWEQFTLFLAFLPEVRRVICTANLIESVNARLRKVTRNRGSVPHRAGRPQSALLGRPEPGRLLGPEHRNPQLGLEASTPGIHHLLRRTNPHAMTTATITYTGDRTLPAPMIEGSVQRGLGCVAPWRGQGCKCPAILRPGGG